MSDVTRIVSAIETVDTIAAEKLLPLVYDELRKLAAAQLASERSDQTLQATANGSAETAAARAGRPGLKKMTRVSPEGEQGAALDGRLRRLSSTMNERGLKLPSFFVLMNWEA